MLKLNKLTTNHYLIGGALGIALYLAADYFGIISQIKSAVLPTQSRVTYYNPSNAYRAGLGDAYGKAHAQAMIGEAFNQGTSSQSGDYNSIPRLEF